MPASPGNDARRSSGGVDPAKLADWEARTFSALRRRRDASTPVDDELPDDPLRDDAETKSALARIRRA